MKVTMRSTVDLEDYGLHQEGEVWDAPNEIAKKLVQDGSAYDAAVHHGAQIAAVEAVRKTKDGDGGSSI